MDPGPLLSSLIAGLAGPFTGETLFDCLADLVFFLKNERAEYVVVNRTLAERCGVADKRELVGRTAAEVFPGPLGEAFHAQDLEILRTGRPILNRLEVHLYPTGEAGWCLTNKVPLRGRGGRVVGLAGISQDLRTPDADATGADLHALARALDLLDAPHDGPVPRVRDLAARSELTAYQLDARVRRLFGLSAKQFALKVRMDRALWALRETEEPIAAIALDVGYSEQSAFTRQFRRTVGLSPAAYRRAWHGIAGAAGPKE